MKKRVCSFLLIFILLLTACGTPANKELQDTAFLYFANHNNTDLVAVTLDVDTVDKEELPRYVMEKLLDGPKDPNLNAAVRVGTKLLSVETENSMAKVDLSKEYYHEETVYDVLALASIVKSLCSVRSIDRVLITIEGAPLLSAEGKEQGILRESDVVFDADALQENEANISLYFSDLNAEYLVREIRTIKLSRGDSLEKRVVEELIRGPKSDKAWRTIPAETKILSVETKDSVCFVNLSSDFVAKNNVGSSGEQLTIYSIVNSLTELSNIDKVQFLIEGKKKDVYHHMIFNEPIARDTSMIQYSILP